MANILDEEGNTILDELTTIIADELGINIPRKNLYRMGTKIKI